MNRLLSTIVLVLSLCILPYASAAGEKSDLYNIFKFGEFPVKVVDVWGPKEPHLKRGTELWNYRTSIRNAAKATTSFAGHYAVAEWGCGTQCQGHAVIDQLTGEVFDAPGSSGGATYFANSRLFVTNTCTGEDPPDWMRQKLYLFDDGEFILFLDMQIELLCDDE